MDTDEFIVSIQTINWFPKYCQQKCDRVARFELRVSRFGISDLGFEIEQLVCAKYEGVRFFCR
jgi:hypothetical protein